MTLTARFLAQLHDQLDETPSGVLEIIPGIRRDGDELELLLPGAAGEAPPSETVRSRPKVRVLRLPAGLRGIPHEYWSGAPGLRVLGPCVDLALNEDGRGCSAAWVERDRVARIDDIRIAGSGNERWRPGHEPAPRNGAVPADGRWSRRIGALGGDAIHDRLRATEAALIAVGGLGTSFARLLSAAGVRKLTLIDPDVVEQHNIDRMEILGTGTLGVPKAEAHARLQRLVAPWTEVVPLAVEADHPDALAACAAADLIITAPDDDAPRLSVAMIAAAYHRMHLDLGTGVRAVGDGIEAGADVRLLVPGDGCAACIGGLELGRRRSTAWRQQRAGSLRSVNQLAASAAMILLERFFAGTVAQSHWQRLRVANDGAVTGEALDATPTPDCRLCGRLAGVGDGLTVSA